MAKNYSINEHKSVEALELFITDSLLNGENVVIPDFGHLEIKSLGERRTVVLYESTDGSDSFLRIISTVDEIKKKNIIALSTIISHPLKEGKIVNLPKVGIFQPIKREMGRIRVSFILSAYLRKLINQANQEERKKAELEIGKEISVTPRVQENKNETPQVKKEEEVLTTDKIHITGLNENPNEAVNIKKRDILFEELCYNTDVTYKYKLTKLSEQLMLQEEKTQGEGRLRSLNGTLIYIAGGVILIMVVVSAIYFRNNLINRKTIDRGEITIGNESVSLTTLAETYYGHSAFWIYIYEANADKLTSPINISKNIRLDIPDLKSKYDVDVNDSMEIQRAKIIADIILKEGMRKK